MIVTANFRRQILEAYRAGACDGLRYGLRQGPVPDAEKWLAEQNALRKGQGRGGGSEAGAYGSGEEETSMKMLRFHIGRCLLHAGLRALPRGRVRSELSAMIDVWSTRVRQEIRRS